MSTTHKPAILNDLTREELESLRAAALDRKVKSEANCRWCGKTFEKNRKWQEFCSAAHQREYHANWRDLTIEHLQQRLATQDRIIAELREELANLGLAT